MELARIFAPVAEELLAVDAGLRVLMKARSRSADRRLRGARRTSLKESSNTRSPCRGKRSGLPSFCSRRTPWSPHRGDALPTRSPSSRWPVPWRSSTRLRLSTTTSSTTRIPARNQVSLNKRFGNRVAVLAGDILYTHFFSVITGMAHVPHKERFALLDIFLDTTKAMCMGEIIAQEVAAARRPLSLSEYIEIATDKTAVLFAACCRTAALLCGVSEAQQVCMGELGLSFGLAFQMADDLVDKDHGLDEKVDLPGVAATLRGDGAGADCHPVPEPPP